MSEPNPVPVTIGRKPLAQRPKIIETPDGHAFPGAEPITVPDGASGIHNLFCPNIINCGFYTVSPYTTAQWEEIGRMDKVACPLCHSRMSDEIIKMPMRVTDKIPVATMVGEAAGLLGKGRHERWDFGGGAGYYNRKIINKGERDAKAWEKMDAWAKGGSATDVNTGALEKETDPD